MKLLSINLQLGGGKRTDSILDYIIKHNTDLVVLGEYQNNKNGQKIQETLKKEGYTHINCDDKFLGVLVASKHPFSVIKKEERIVGIELEDYNLRLLGVYVPTGSNDQQFKDTVWQEIIKFADENQETPSIIVGDFNSCTKDDSMNQTEYNPDDLIKMNNMGWVDAWAQSDNGDQDRYTWYITRNGKKTGFRLDYAFISPELEKQIKNMKIYHDSEKRVNKMTDHSPLIMEYSL